MCEQTDIIDYRSLVSTSGISCLGMSNFFWQAFSHFSWNSFPLLVHVYLIITEENTDRFNVACVRGGDMIISNNRWKIKIPAIKIVEHISSLWLQWIKRIQINTDQNWNICNWIRNVYYYIVTRLNLKYKNLTKI